MCNKIRLLIEKNLYDVALRLLHREGSTYSQEAALVRFQYGNYLLLKGDISRAVKEFIKTIGFIKPYSVISKLLCSRYNSYLKEYLSEWNKINKTSNSYTKLIECCIKREQIKHEIQQISDNNKILNCTSSPELKQLSNLSKMYFECKIRNQSQVEEEHLLHRFLEYGPEKLLVSPTTYLENIKFENVNTPENILSFLSMLPDQSDYRSKVLAEIIEKFPNCNENLYFYLLLLYLVLWQKKQVTTSYVLNFVKKKGLRLDRVLIICRLYSFFDGIQEMNNNQQNDDALQHEAVNKCIHTLIENNPKGSLNCNISKRTFLIMLKSSCSNDKVKALRIKPLLREKIIRDIVDSANEVQLIANFNDKIRRSSLMLSLYTNNPMEFRNDSCDICRETLTTQSIYFLCQHSYHKECLSYNSTKRREEVICVVCKTKKNLLNIKSAININSDSSNIISGIAKVLAIGTKKIENKIMIKKYVKTISESNDKNKGQGKNESVSLNNPFD
nr:vacuolar protein sorting-associated protein 11 homolog [Drosophila takahashii]